MSQETTTIAIPVVMECPKCGWTYYQRVNISKDLLADWPAFTSYISSGYSGIPDNPKFKEHDCKGGKK